MSALDTLTLEGWQLDYFTGLALGYDMMISNDGAGPAYRADRTISSFSPGDSPADLAPVLLKMRCIMKGHWPGEWMARADGCNAYATGTTLPVAACRALVLGRWGSTVELVAAPGGDCVGSYVNDSNSCEDLF